MARYIDADVLYGKLYPLDLVDKKLYTINAKAVADAIAKTPTADVAPKSEVAREIFEEIEKHLFVIAPLEEFDGQARLWLDDLTRIKKKYTEEPSV